MELADTGAKSRHWVSTAGLIFADLSGTAQAEPVAPLPAGITLIGDDGTCALGHKRPGQRKAVLGSDTLSRTTAPVLAAAKVPCEHAPGVAFCRSNA